LRYRGANVKLDKNAEIVENSWSHEKLSFYNRLIGMDPKLV